jgi:putative Holliday junction resolvase
MARILGIDYGVKRIGLALSDPLLLTARPYEVIHRTSLREDVQRIRTIVTEQEVSCIVVGLPLNMDGSPGILTDEVTSFAETLRKELSVTVELYDERLTTLQADRMLTEEADISREKRKMVRDKLAASLILQSYLEQKQQG